MPSFRTVLLPAALMLLVGGSAAGRAQDGEADAAPVSESDGSQPVAEHQRAYQLIRPCIGAGYIAYSYPAVGSCPCGDDLCFNPHRYYCCGKEYKKAWFHKWAGSHLGKRSMLDDYCCPCLYPRVAPRPYLRTVKFVSEPPVLEPDPLPAAPEPADAPAPSDGPG